VSERVKLSLSTAYSYVHQWLSDLL